MMIIAIVFGVLLLSSVVCFGIGAEGIKFGYQLLTTLQLTPSMKKLMLFAAVSFALFASAVTIGCGGNKTSDTSRSSPSGPVPSGSSGSSSSGSYSSGSGSGGTTSGSGSGGTTTGGPQYVYTANNGANSISEFVINSDGTLTSLGVPVSTVASPALLAAAKGTLLVGAWQFVNNQLQGTVSSYSIGSTGGIAFESSVSPVPYLSSMVLDNTGLAAYVGSEGSIYPTVSGPAYISELAIPGLTNLPGSPIVLNNPQGNPYRPEALTMTANNNFLYGEFFSSESGDVSGVLSRNADRTISGFAPGSPVSTGCAGLVMANELNQMYLFQNCGGPIGSSAIDPVTGRILITFPPFQSPTGASLIPYIVDPSEKWLFASGNDGALHILSIDPTTGSLNEDGKHIFRGVSPPPSNGAGPGWVFDGSGKLFYTLSGNSIVGYHFDPNSGLLTPIAGAYATGQLPRAIIVTQ